MTAPAAVLPSREEGEVLLDRVGAAALGGVAAGFVIGGIGGRLAMLVLRLTSNDSVRGIESDDGFTIGRVSTETFFLLAATTLVGAALAFVYLLVRRWLPGPGRPLQAAVFFALIGGAAVVEPDGVDFTFLDPLWLAVLLFVALPAAYGWAMAAAVEWLIDHPGRARKARVAALVLFVVVGFVGVVAVPVVLAGLLLFLAGRRWPRLAGLVEHPVPTWMVRIALVVLAAVAGADLLADTAEIL